MVEHANTLFGFLLGFFSGSEDEATSPPKRNAADPVPSGKMGCENERSRDA
jgi:hypothetical protein